MSRRLPLLVAVVGALLVGGATTGATGATWTDQRQLGSHGVGSGAMSFTTTTPAGVSVARTAGAAATTSFVLDDTSAGKNLQQRITTQVAGTPTGVTATVGTSCPGAASVQVDTTPTSADVTLCVRVVSSATAVSGSVTLNVSGAQRPSGWTTPVATVTVPVTVGTPPAAPVISCTPDQKGISWSAVSGATQYVVSSSSTSPTTGYSDVATQTTTTPYTPSLAGNGTPNYYRVRSANDAGSSGSSNTLRITRTGSTYTCGAVTP